MWPGAGGVPGAGVVCEEGWPTAALGRRPPVMLIESNGGFENVYVPQVAVARDSGAPKAMSARNATSPTAMRGSRAGTPRRYADGRAVASGLPARGLDRLLHPDRMVRSPSRSERVGAW